MELEETDNLPDTVRGEGGFGSTGKWVQINKNEIKRFPRQVILKM